MKVFRFYESRPSHRYEIVFETTDREEMYNYIVDRIWANELTYDPCCNYPSKDTQVELFDKHFREYKHDYIQNILEGYIEAKELNPQVNKNDRDSYIKLKLVEHFKEAQELNHEVFAIAVQGSQNYNLDVYSDDYYSDIDTKCIVLPSLDSVIKNDDPISETHERDNKEHIDLKDIRVMFDCFKKQNVNFIEILFSDFYIVPDKYKEFWNELLQISESLVRVYPASTVRSIAGMSMQKLKALKHPYPTLIDKINKFGYDPKQLHHIVRLNDFIKKFVAGVSFKDALRPDSKMSKYLLDLKLGKLSLEEAEKLAKDCDSETNNIKNEYIKIYGDSLESEAVYEQLDNIKLAVMKKYFVEEVTKNHG